jgi:hypothetical protein
VELRTAEGATIRISSLTKRDVRDVHALLTDIVNRPREEDDSSA